MLTTGRVGRDGRQTARDKRGPLLVEARCRGFPILLH